jgi:hypothetical protein
MGAYNISVRESEEKVGRPRRRWKINIKMDVKEIV